MNIWRFIFGSQELIVSSIAICGVFSLLNILYPRFKNIKIITHFMYTTTENLVNQYAFRAHFLLFFLFVFYIILTNNILSIFSFPTLFLNKTIIGVIVCTNTILGLTTGIYYKKHRAITDLVDPSLPIILQIICFPLELISVSIRIIILLVRPYVFAIVGHNVLDAILHVCSTSSSYFMSVAATALAIIVKIMDLFTGIIQAYVFILLCAILFGKFNKKLSK